MESRVHVDVDGMQVLLDDAERVKGDESVVEELRESGDHATNEIVRVAEREELRGDDRDEDLELADFVALDDATPEDRELTHEEQVHHEQRDAHHSSLVAFRLQQLERNDDDDFKQISHRLPIVELRIVLQVIVSQPVLAHRRVEFPTDSPHLRPHDQREARPQHENQPRDSLPVRFVVFAQQFRVVQQVLLTPDLSASEHLS